MKILLCEIKKSMQVKFIILLLLFSIINLVLGYKDTKRVIVDSGENKQFYREVETLGLQEHNQKNYEQLKEFINVKLNNTLSFRTENVYRKALIQLDVIYQYKQFLTDIQNRANNMMKVSIYAKKGTFAYRNIQKTPKAYDRLEQNQLTFGNSQGILFATERRKSDILAVIIMFLFCSSIIISEKEKGLFSMLRTMRKGRAKLIRTKLYTAYGYGFLTALFLYGGNILLSANLYGLGNLTRYIQSVEGFQGSVLNVSVLEYLIIFFISRILLCWFVASLIILVSIIAKNNLVIYSVPIIIAGLSAVCYFFIDGNSILSPLKYNNILGLCELDKMAENYLNMNLFGYPINVLNSSIIVAVIVIILLFLLGQLFFSTMKNQSYQQIRIIELIKRRRTSRSYTTRLFLQEAKKILIKNNVVFILCAAVILGWYQYTSFQVQISEDEGYYKKQMNAVTGVVSDDTIQYLAEQEKRFQDIREKQKDIDIQYEQGEIDQGTYAAICSQIRDDLKEQQAVLEVKNKVNELETLAMESASSKDLWMVYDTGYNKLFEVSKFQEADFSDIIFLLLLIACIAPVYGIDNKKKLFDLLRTTRFGRKHSFMCRTLIIFLITMILGVLTYLPNILNIGQYYGLQGLNAPIQSLNVFRDFPLDISIRTGLIMMYSLKLIGALLIALLLISISILSKSDINAIGTSMVIIVLPMLLLAMGGTFLNYAVYNPFIKVNNLLLLNAISRGKRVGLVIDILLAMCIEVLLVQWTYRRINPRRTKH